MDTVGTVEAKTRLIRLLERVAAGKQITITRALTGIYSEKSYCGPFRSEVVVPKSLFRNRAAGQIAYATEHGINSLE
jgi:hypothetical protein